MLDPAPTRSGVVEALVFMLGSEAGSCVISSPAAEETMQIGRTGQNPGTLRNIASKLGALEIVDYRNIDTIGSSPRNEL
jgi:hypothetical protein